MADHPRIRGEHIGLFRQVPSKAGSSPHTRGARHQYPRAACRERIIPAYAGSTLAARVAWVPAWDHPRIRGEHDTPLTNVTPFTGSSPHTRGARVHGHSLPQGPRIIPAYAGSTSREVRHRGRQ